MRSHGKHTLALQHGQTGFYSAIELAVDVEDGDDGLFVVFQAPLESGWQFAAAFGIAYARERLPRSAFYGRVYKVTVLRADWHTVDTTAIALAFSAAHAFWQAMNQTESLGFDLDAASGIFRVSK